MKKKIEIVKAVASGNDFIIIDKFREQNVGSRIQIGKLARELCQRKLSVGADGLLIIEPSKQANFKMRIFNPDGSEVDMCGNGSRCVALYANKSKICGHRMVIETRAGSLQAEVKKDLVGIKMPKAEELKLKFTLNVNGQSQEVNYINTGVPHVVSFVRNLKDFNVGEIGKAIRYHCYFQPAGTNVNFVEVLNKSHIKVRTYERGVEQETLACGTGCVAAAIVTIYQMQSRPEGAYKLVVDTQSGETLSVYLKIRKDLIDEVSLEGRAEIVYRGQITPHLSSF